MKRKIFLISLVVILILTGCNKEEKENTQTLETNGMLSYTIDGEATIEKPTKEEGYIVNKIVCANGSDMMWDNDNWEVELTSIKSNDVCMVDFTKDNNVPGYRITVTSNDTSSLDSTSKATTEKGTVIIYTKSVPTSVTGCDARIEDNKVIVENVTLNQTCNIIINAKTLANTILAEYPSSGARSSFDTVYGATALHEATDYDENGAFSGTSYYFTGNPNNWVSFAGSLWRIIRINGNGSVRLLYAGSGGEDGYIGSVQTYNATSSHPAYVGWKYTVGGSLVADRANSNKSEAYTTVETWYNGLSINNQNYIDTEAMYCNDRSIGRGFYTTSTSTVLAFDYAGYTRLITNKTPTFECSDTADSFTTFGLMTADEVAYAGGLIDINNESVYYYLNTSGGSSTGLFWWWTMSPSHFSASLPLVFSVRGSSYPGYLGSTIVYSSGVLVIRPVVSLKSNVLVTRGDGSANSPYEVNLP